MAITYYYDLGTTSWKPLLDINVPAHNDTTGLQGGTTDEYYHLTSAEHTSILALVGVTDGDKGDITVSSSGTVWTVDNAAITYDKIQNVSATDKLLGRSSAGAGSIEEITCTSAGRALLDDATAADQRATLGLGATDGPTFNHIHIGTLNATAGTFNLVDRFGCALYYSSADNNGPGITTYKRGSASGIDAAVASSGQLGYTPAYGWNGSAYYNGGYFMFRASEAWSGSACGTDMVVAVTPNGSASRTIAFSVLNSSNVLMGTTTETAGIRCKVVGGSIATDCGLSVGSATVDAADGCVEMASATSNLPYLNLINSTNDALCGRFKFGKIRGTSIVQSGDYLGAIDFWGYDGSAYRQAAQIIGASDGTPGASDMPGKIAFLVTPDGSATMAVAATIKSNGDLLVGTSSTVTGVRLNVAGGGVQTDGLVKCGETSSYRQKTGFSIADDAVYSFTPADVYGGLFVFRTATASQNGCAILNIRTSGSANFCEIVYAQSSIEVSTAALNGTTGTDGKITISACNDGKIYIENRSGGTRYCSFVTLAGYGS